MSTRPRITFDSQGRCNACQWAEEKKTLDWSKRKSELSKILDEFRSTDGAFDCVVPVSGGKDGSYVAYQLKHVYGMHPLAITVTPALTLELGNQTQCATFGSNQGTDQQSFQDMTRRKVEQG